jgi:hypothetical protein
VDAIADEDEHTRGSVATVIVAMPVVAPMPAVVVSVFAPTVPAVVTAMLAVLTLLARIFVIMRVRVSPQHEFLDDEEHAEPDQQSDADGMRSAWPDALHRLRQQSQQRSANQRAGREAHEMREHPKSRLFG